MKPVGGDYLQKDKVEDIVFYLLLLRLHSVD